ncbi:MAG: UTP--glucose-1-phosphate uridylyltransferase [bacterium]
MKITKAIIPAAGLGTRFLPQTKAMPKEMLPIIDKPVIQYVVEEAVAAGITDIIIVTGQNKRAVEDHFDHQYALEASLRDQGKIEIAEELERIADMANFIYVRQKGHYGNGTPILNAAHLIGDEPFLVLWADDFVRSTVPRAVQLVEAFEKLQAPVISLIPIDPGDTNKYGVPKIKSNYSDDIFEIEKLIEKPGPAHAPSSYGSVGGYILTPDIIALLETQKPDKTGEIYLSSAIDQLATMRPVYGKVIEGQWHDTGSKSSYLQAIVDVALEDKSVGPELRAYLEQKLKDS